METMYQILYPETRWVPASKLILWASDDVENGEHPGPKPETAEDAIEILNDTGSVTVGKGRR